MINHVLLVLDGDVALYFLHKVLSDYYGENHYIVVYKDDRFLPSDISSSFLFHKCDYTSHFRMDELLKTNVSDAFIVLEDSNERNEVYKYLRTKFKNIRIITNVQKDSDLEISNDLKNDSKLILINEINALSARLLARIPNVPVIARGFGLELGEVMEIGIPSGSIYAHRQIGTIRQNDWKIVGVYRNNEFKLANYHIVILPGDILLVAGDPVVLRNIYNQIKSDLGQFPLPFGRNLYVYIDMTLQSKRKIFKILKETLYLHKNLKSLNLIIRILRPNNFQVLQEIVELADSDIIIRVDYDNNDLASAIDLDKGKKIGCIIIGEELFLSRQNRKALFNAQIPVYKVGRSSIIPQYLQDDIAKNEIDNLNINGLEFHKLNVKAKKLKQNSLKEFINILNQAGKNKDFKNAHLHDIHESFVVISDISSETNISSVIFDISKQLGFDVRVYDFEIDGHFSDEVEDEYYNLSKIFSKNVQIDRVSHYNPILYLRTIERPVLHFVPFTKGITKTRFLALFKTNFEDLSFLVNNNPQIFIPI